MSELQFTPVSEGAVQVVELAGRLDHTTAAQFDAKISALPADKVVLDLARLDYISSAGLRSVLGALKKLAAAGGSLALAAPSSAVEEVFEISGFVTLVTIHPSRAEAVAALG
jgi:anti-sigma B factor antagonist